MHHYVSLNISQHQAAPHEFHHTRKAAERVIGVASWVAGGKCEKIWIGVPMIPGDVVLGPIVTSGLNCIYTRIYSKAVPKHEPLPFKLN